MSDHFGISEAVQACLRIYFQGARGSGRTTSMIESAKPGDRLVFCDVREGERVKRLLKEAGIEDVICCVVDPENPSAIFQRPPSEGRTIFDHSWVEEYFMRIIVGASNDLRRLQDQASGYGTPHRETARKAKEMGRWRG